MVAGAVEAAAAEIIAHDDDKIGRARVRTGAWRGTAKGVEEMPAVHSEFRVSQMAEKG